MLFMSVVAPPAEAGSTAGKWSVQKSGVEDDLLDVAFLNEKVGVAVGKHQTIVRTSDGGKTWKRVIERVKDGPELYAVIFANDKLGYAITSVVGTILHTKDGGTTWVKTPIPDAFDVVPPAGHLATHAVHNSSYYYLCWGGSGSRLFKTENAGRAWVEYKMKPEPSLGYGLAGIAFPDGRNGCLVNARASVPHNWAVTQDEGRTWGEQGKLDDKVDRGTGLHLQFVDKNHGWFLPTSGATIYATDNGGKTWTPQKIGDNTPTSMEKLHFANAKIGHVLFDEPRIQDEAVWQTADGGKTWRSLGKVSPPGYLHGLSFPSAQTGWVVGAKGYIACYSGSGG